MPTGSAMRIALSKLIKDVQNEIANESAQSGNLKPIQATVINVNDDGTVDVIADDGTTYFAVGYPDVQVVPGQFVILVSANGVQAAIPQ